MLGVGCEEEIMDDALREAKLATLIEVEGYDSVEEMIEAVFSDSVSPAICMNVERSRSKEKRFCIRPRKSTIADARIFTTAHCLLEANLICELPPFVRDVDSNSARKARAAACGEFEPVVAVACGVA
jgi:hypothetical protein